MHKIFSKGFFFDSSTPHDRDRTVITNRRRFDQQTRSRPLIVITASSDGSRSTSLNINTVIRYRYLPIPVATPSSGTGSIQYRTRSPLESDTVIQNWMMVSGTGYRSLGTGIGRYRYRMTVRTTIGEPYLERLRFMIYKGMSIVRKYEIS